MVFIMHDKNSLLFSPRHLPYLLGVLGLVFNHCSVADIQHGGLFAQEIIIDDPAEPTCDVISPNGEYDYNYNQLYAGMFKNNQKTELPYMTRTLEIVCNEPVSDMFFTVESDNLSDSFSEPDPTHFSLGPIHGGGHLGYFQARLENARIDNNTVKLYQTNNNKAATAPQGSILLQSKKSYGWRHDSKDSSTGKRYSVDVTILPTLYSLKETNGPLVEGGDLNGELALTFTFGI